MRGRLTSAGAVGIAVALCALATVARAAAAQAPTSAASAPTVVDATARPPSEPERFLTLLGAWRGGDDSLLSELRATADRCALGEDRPEYRTLVEFFARLSRDERVRGLERERLFDAVRKDVHAAAGLDVAAWRALRPRIFERLDEIVTAAVDEPGFTPAARALSLRALLRATRVAQDREMSATERQQWVESGRRDAERALELFERASMLSPQLESLHALAGLELASDHRERAADLYADMRDLARHVHQTKLEASALVGLARLAQESGDLADSARLLDEIARIASPSTNWELAKRQGEFLLAVDEPASAATFLKANRPRERDAIVEWHVLMEGALIRAGDRDGAQSHIAALSANPADVDLAALARADAMLHTADEAAARLALQVVADPMRLPPRLQADYHRLDGCVHLKQGDREAAARAFERALSVGDSIEARLSRTSVAAPTASVMGESIGLETVALLAGVRVQEERALEAAALIEDRQLHALRASIAAGGSARVTTEVVRAWADAYEFGMITWVVGADTTVVVHVARGGDAVGRQLAVGRADVTAAALRLREAAIAHDEPRARALAAEIQAVLLPAAITERLHANPSADQGRVLLCAHGPIEDIAFALLPVFSDVTQRRLVPVQLPGLLAATRGPAVTRADLTGWSVLGDPVSGDGMELLPGATAEIDAIARRTQSPFVRSGERFDRAAFTAALSSGRALHLATHLRSDAASGRAVDSRFARAAFELSNGERFDVADIRRAAPRLPLAVLSACETGSGQFVDGQASLGVVRAFLESGTRNLVVTSWPVEDRAARQFAIALHAALESGKSPSRAVVAARESMRSAGASMADWAAFELVGRD